MGANGVIFGPPGIGKTTLASGAVALGETVLIDSDHGRRSVAHVEGLKFYVPESFKDLRKLLDEAIAQGASSPVRTWIFDSLSSIYYKLVLPHVTGSDTAQVTQPQYGEAERLLSKFVSDTVVLSEEGINTIFLGHVKEESDGDVVNIRMGLPQGIRNDILRNVHFVGYYARGRRPEDRVLYFEPPNRRVDGPKQNQAPEFRLDSEIRDPNIADIFKAMKGEK